jgi:hypothetical protein
MVEIHLGPGESVKVVLRETDGEFVFGFGSEEPNRLFIHADLPDDSGRSGVIYEETWDNSEDREAWEKGEKPRRTEEPRKACGSVKPGTGRGRSNRVICLSPAGHEGDHTCAGDSWVR